jgi:site-specific recombinase XerC
MAAGTINQRLAAVRRLAYDAADSGLLSPELAAGIRPVKGVKQLGTRAGNWLNVEQARLLLNKADCGSLRGNRDLAMISILLGCGLRRAELASFEKGKYSNPSRSLGHRRLNRKGWSRP